MGKSKMINKQVLRIIERENKDILRNILIDLCQQDKRNESRIEELYNKYK